MRRHIMGKGKFMLELTNLFTIYRWNNRPGIVRFTEADNAFHGLISSLFIFDSEYKNKKNNIILNRLYKEFPKIILSDISLETKTRIKKKNPEVWNNLQLKAYSDVNEIFSPDVLNFNFREVDKETELIDSYINYFVNLKEISINSRIYEEYYKLPEEEIYSNINRLKPKLSTDIDNYLNHILETTLRMSHMIRWNKNHRNIRSSVAAHSFFATVVSFLLSYDTVDSEMLNKILKGTIIHDLPEAFTGDVITPTKKKVTGMEEIISEIEEDFILEWSNENKCVKNFVENNLKLITDPFSGDAGKFIRTADLLSAMVECAIEIKTGNQDELFRNAFFSTKKAVQEISPIDIYDIIDEIEINTFR